MKQSFVTRRQVLRGAGGFSLGLPFLPSLHPRRADGAEIVPTGRKYFVASCTQHGAIRDSNMYPTAATLTQSQEIHPGHSVKFGPLSARREGADAVLSAVLRAPADKLTDRLIGKMNVMRGFDIPYYIGHHTGGHLGNFVRSDQGPKNLKPWPTVDQVIAWSERFYTSAAGIRLRSIVTGQDFHGQSFNYSNPAAKSGGIQKVAVQSSPSRLFDQLIAGASNNPMAERRQPIVDKVLTNYRSLRESNRRLSVDDRRRIDDHIGRLAELEKRIEATATKSCPDFMRPTGESMNGLDSPTVAGRYFGLVHDVIAMAFACGTSRVATIWIHTPFHDSYPGSWHQETAHQWQNADAQARLVQGLQRTFALTILDLAAKLDSIEDSPGVSVLDNTLYQWTQESGWATHDAQDMPIVTFGKAGGYIKSGQFVDFRNMKATAHLDIFGKQSQFTGLWIRQWLATAAQAMDLRPQDFEQDGKTGFGDPHWAAKYDQAVHANVINRASDPVPIVTAG